MQENWDHTALLVATVSNILRDPKKSKAVKAEEIHPFYRPKKTKAQVPITVLKDLFVKN